MQRALCPTTTRLFSVSTESSQRLLFNLISICCNYLHNKNYQAFKLAVLMVLDARPRRTSRAFLQKSGIPLLQRVCIRGVYWSRHTLIIWK